MRTRRHIPSRHHPRTRVNRYSEAPVIESRSCGVLDTPLEPVIGLAEGETRWRSMTVSGGARRRLAMTGAGGNSLNANAPHTQPSSPANAGEPVFQGVGDGAEVSRRTGSTRSRGRRKN